MVHFLCRQQVIVQALVAVRLDVAQGRRVRACLVHQGADTPFMAPGERTVDCIDEGQPTNQRHGVELLMAQRVNTAPRLISVPFPGPAMTEGQTPCWLGRTVSADLLGGLLWMGSRRAAVIVAAIAWTASCPGATHLFEEEAGALEQVAPLASSWFTTHLSSLEDTA